MSAVSELEAKLKAMKEAGDTDSDEYRQVKLDLREARFEERTAREQTDVEVDL